MRNTVPVLRAAGVELGRFATGAGGAVAFACPAHTSRRRHGRERRRDREQCRVRWHGSIFFVHTGGDRALILARHIMKSAPRCSRPERVTLRPGSAGPGA
jgi:hypothetical protein